MSAHFTELLLYLWSYLLNSSAKGTQLTQLSFLLVFLTPKLLVQHF